MRDIGDARLLLEQAAPQTAMAPPPLACNGWPPLAVAAAAIRLHANAIINWIPFALA